jgi:uncharacterized RDD family membrane protein YckC
MDATNPSQGIDYEQATFYRRLAARVIDVVVVVLALLPLSLLIMYPFYSGATAEVGTWVSFALWIVLVIAYDTVMLRLLGKTLGKMALGIEVVDVRGERLGWGPCLLRTTMLYLSLIVVVFGVFVTASILGWVILRALPERPRLPHDKAVKCLVVRRAKGRQVAAAPGVVYPGPAKQPTMFPDLERLRDQGIISEDEYQRKRREVGL